MSQIFDSKRPVFQQIVPVGDSKILHSVPESDVVTGDMESPVVFVKTVDVPEGSVVLVGTDKKLVMQTALAIELEEALPSMPPRRFFIREVHFDRITATAKMVLVQRGV